MFFRSSFPARSDRLWRIIKHALFLVERNIFSVSRYFKCNAESSACMLHLWIISGLELTTGSYCNYAGIFCLMISLHRIVPNKIKEWFFSYATDVPVVCFCMLFVVNCWTKYTPTRNQTQFYRTNETDKAIGNLFQIRQSHELSYATRSRMLRCNEHSDHLERNMTMS